jgi:hypothetical protein
MKNEYMCTNTGKCNWRGSKSCHFWPGGCKYVKSFFDEPERPQCPYHKPMLCAIAEEDHCVHRNCRHHPETTYPKNPVYGRRR